MILNFSKTISILLVGVVFSTNCLLAHSAETNLWAQRQESLQKIKPKAPTPPLMASLPPLVHQPFLPALQSQAVINQTRPGDKNLAPLLQSLPPAIGTVRKINAPRTRQTKLAAGEQSLVVHIQDIHRNREAQENIGNAIQSLIDKRQVDMVALEGAFDTIDLSAFRSFPHQDSIRKMADAFFKNDKFSGPLHTALTSSAAIPPIVGIDDQNHYEANVEAYKRSAPLIKPAKEKLALKQRQIEDQKKKTFNSPLAAFDASIQAYRKGSTTLGDYVQLLSKQSDRFHPSVETFLSALQIEASLDFSKVESERAALLTQLLHELTKDQSKELIDIGVAYRLGNIPHGRFYGYLKDRCEKSGVSLTRFPAMNDYVRYMLLSDQIDSEHLFSDMREMEKGAYDSLAKSSEERELIEKSHQLYLMGKLLDFALTTDEWAEYKSVIPALDSRFRGNDDVVTFNAGLVSFEEFYREAEARDIAMAKNLLNAMAKHNAKSVVLVTGGFHTRGIETILKKSEITTVTFVPKISKVETENGSAYLTAFTQEKTPLNKLFDGNKLFLAQLVFPSDQRADAAFSAAREATATHPGLTFKSAATALLAGTGMTIIWAFSIFGKEVCLTALSNHSFALLVVSATGISLMMAPRWSWIQSMWAPINNGFQFLVEKWSFSFHQPLSNPMSLFHLSEFQEKYLVPAPESLALALLVAGLPGYALYRAFMNANLLNSLGMEGLILAVLMMAVVLIFWGGVVAVTTFKWLHKKNGRDVGEGPLTAHAVGVLFSTLVGFIAPTFLLLLNSAPLPETQLAAMLIGITAGYWLGHWIVHQYHNITQTRDKRMSLSRKYQEYTDTFFKSQGLIGKYQRIVPIDYCFSLLDYEREYYLRNRPRPETPAPNDLSPEALSVNRISSYLEKVLEAFKGAYHRFGDSSETWPMYNQMLARLFSRYKPSLSQTPYSGAYQRIDSTQFAITKQGETQQRPIALWSDAKVVISVFDPFSGIGLFGHLPAPEPGQNDQDYFQQLSRAFQNQGGNFSKAKITLHSTKMNRAVFFASIMAVRAMHHFNVEASQISIDGKEDVRILDFDPETGATLNLADHYLNWEKIGRTDTTNKNILQLQNSIEKNGNIKKMTSASSLPYLVFGNKKWGTVGMFGEMGTFLWMITNDQIPWWVTAVVIVVYGGLHLPKQIRAKKLQEDLPSLLDRVISHGIVFGSYLIVLIFIQLHFASPYFVALPLLLHGIIDIRAIWNKEIEKAPYSISQMTEKDLDDVYAKQPDQSVGNHIHWSREKIQAFSPTAFVARDRKTGELVGFIFYHREEHSQRVHISHLYYTDNSIEGSLIREVISSYYEDQPLLTVFHVDRENLDELISLKRQPALKIPEPEDRGSYYILRLTEAKREEKIRAEEMLKARVKIRENFFHCLEFLNRMYWIHNEEKPQLEFFKDAPIGVAVQSWSPDLFRQNKLFLIRIILDRVSNGDYLLLNHDDKNTLSTFLSNINLSGSLEDALSNKRRDFFSLASAESETYSDFVNFLNERNSLTDADKINLHVTSDEDDPEQLFLKVFYFSLVHLIPIVLRVLENNDLDSFTTENHDKFTEFIRDLKLKESLNRMIKKMNQTDPQAERPEIKASSPFRPASWYQRSMIHERRLTNIISLQNEITTLVSLEYASFEDLHVQSRKFYDPGTWHPENALWLGALYEEMLVRLPRVEWMTAILFAIALVMQWVDSDAISVEALRTFIPVVFLFKILLLVQFAHKFATDRHPSIFMGKNLLPTPIPFKSKKGDMPIERQKLRKLALRIGGLSLIPNAFTLFSLAIEPNMDMLFLASNHAGAVLFTYIFLWFYHGTWSVQKRRTGGPVGVMSDGKSSEGYKGPFELYYPEFVEKIERYKTKKKSPTIFNTSSSSNNRSIYLNSQFPSKQEQAISMTLMYIANELPYMTDDAPLRAHIPKKSKLSTEEINFVLNNINAFIRPILDGNNQQDTRLAVDFFMTAVVTMFPLDSSSATDKVPVTRFSPLSINYMNNSLYEDLNEFAEEILNNREIERAIRFMGLDAVIFELADGPDTPVVQTVQPKSPDGARLSPMLRIDIPETYLDAETRPENWLNEVGIEVVRELMRKKQILPRPSRYALFGRIEVVRFLKKHGFFNLYEYQLSLFKNNLEKRQIQLNATGSISALEFLEDALMTIEIQRFDVQILFVTLYDNYCNYRLPEQFIRTQFTRLFHRDPMYLGIKPRWSNSNPLGSLISKFEIEFRKSIKPEFLILHPEQGSDFRDHFSIGAKNSESVTIISALLTDLPPTPHEIASAVFKYGAILNFSISHETDQPTMSWDEESKSLAIRLPSRFENNAPLLTHWVYCSMAYAHAITNGYLSQNTIDALKTRYTGDHTEMFQHTVDAAALFTAIMALKRDGYPEFAKTIAAKEKEMEVAFSANMDSNRDIALSMLIGFIRGRYPKSLIGKKDIEQSRPNDNIRRGVVAILQPLFGFINRELKPGNPATWQTESDQFIKLFNQIMVTIDSTYPPASSFNKAPPSLSIVPGHGRTWALVWESPLLTLIIYVFVWAFFGQMLNSSYFEVGLGLWMRFAVLIFPLWLTGHVIGIDFYTATHRPNSNRLRLGIQKVHRYAIWSSILAGLAITTYSYVTDQALNLNVFFLMMGFSYYAVHEGFHIRHNLNNDPADQMTIFNPKKNSNDETPSDPVISLGSVLIEAANDVSRPGKIQAPPNLWSAVNRKIGETFQSLPVSSFDLKQTESLIAFLETNLQTKLQHKGLTEEEATHMAEILSGWIGQSINIGEVSVEIIVREKDIDNVKKFINQGSGRKIILVGERDTKSAFSEFGDRVEFKEIDGLFNASGDIQEDILTTYIGTSHLGQDSTSVLTFSRELLLELNLPPFSTLYNRGFKSLEDFLTEFDPQNQMTKVLPLGMVLKLIHALSIHA